MMIFTLTGCDEISFMCFKQISKCAVFPGYLYHIRASS
ncbi:hypothetical protein L466_03721 [Enterobacter sp. BIDMC 30]|nr:hypothetical protein L466_03721 [Enterobacter sp. BIDMC 30]